MANSLLGQALRGMLGGSAPMRGGLMGGMGQQGLGRDQLGGGMGGMASSAILAALMRKRGPRGMLLAMVLPYAMRWVQQNGGVGAVLSKMKARGMQRQASSWVSSGPNEPLDPASARSLLGDGAISDIARQAGASPQEVGEAFAEVLPEVVDELTPEGQVTEASERMLAEGLPRASQELERARREAGEAA